MDAYPVSAYLPISPVVEMHETSDRGTSEEAGTPFLAFLHSIESTPHDSEPLARARRSAQLESGAAELARVLDSWRTKGMNPDLVSALADPTMLPESDAGRALHQRAMDAVVAAWKEEGRYDDMVGRELQSMKDSGEYGEVVADLLRRNPERGQQWAEQRMDKFMRDWDDANYIHKASTFAKLVAPVVPRSERTDS